MAEAKRAGVEIENPVFGLGGGQERPALPKPLENRRAGWGGGEVLKSGLEAEGLQSSCSVFGAL